MVERNIIINADRGIGFGLGKQKGHDGGVIKNNFVHVTRDVGIGLESSPNTSVAHNTVVTTNYPNAIEYRFSKTKNVSIAYNLTNSRIASRNGGAASLTDNIDYAQLNWFKDAAAGDLHLNFGVPVVKGAAMATPGIKEDIDCDLRDPNKPVDIGADQSDLPIDMSIKIERPNRVISNVSAIVDQTVTKSASLLSPMVKSKIFLVGGLIGLIAIAVLSYVLFAVLSELRGIRRAIERQNRS